MHYLDTTGEQDWLITCDETYGADFAAAGLLLSPGVAHMYTTGEIAAELCLEQPGLDTLDIADVKMAQELGYTIKLLGVAELTPKGLQLSVGPTLVKNGNRYTGTAADVVGTAQGEAQGSALHWTYVLSLPVDGKVWEMDMDDWMYLVDDKTLLNRTSMSKYGFKVGDVVSIEETRPISKTKKWRLVTDAAASAS